MRQPYAWYSVSAIESEGLHHYIHYMMTKTHSDFYATVAKKGNYYTADVFYTDGRVFMRNFLYNFKTKYKLLMELAALGVDVRQAQV